ncbi:uncharacterized protein LOC117092861 isoform X3 [Trachypithecus francoisi]|uniref:uncharacterized protein LOC117092861 isoform X3 n=1 Tax=Trachypithecus francoisi TaxID=54180 RepID=UPI00141BBA30|nr:uncharacterized protein LOC117092861 isoform X3 [Trachypithecus francoisi]
MGPNPRGKAGGSFIWGGARAGSGEALTRKRARGGPVRNRPGGGASSPFLLRPSSRGPAPAAAARRTTPTRGSGSWGHRLKAAAAMSSERDTGGPNAQDKHGLNQVHAPAGGALTQVRTAVPGEVKPRTLGPKNLTAPG